MQAKRHADTPLFPRVSVDTEHHFGNNRRIKTKQSDCALNQRHLVPSHACYAACQRPPANLRDVAEQVAPHKHGEGHFPEVSAQDDGVKRCM